MRTKRMKVIKKEEQIKNILRLEVQKEKNKTTMIHISFKFMFLFIISFTYKIITWTMVGLEVP